MIKNQYLIPEFYVNKIPYCDVCDVPLEQQNEVLLSSPPMYMFKCPSCDKEYTFRENEVKGEWKWRTM